MENKLNHLENRLETNLNKIEDRMDQLELKLESNQTKMESHMSDIKASIAGSEGNQYKVIIGIGTTIVATLIGGIVTMAMHLK